ncbi:uncharacterized protein LOC142332341 isoform X2 [Lycorma delicatula]|uniref:uncharacterized protein LOC142332341 isoform X2 n=1 Tax=Lycorma delicatula TaxID=130591 RepID=UPI003F515F29
MDEAAWAILLCKETSSDQQTSLEEFDNENHHLDHCIQQHYTDLSNSHYVDDGQNYNNNNSETSTCINNNNNNSNTFKQEKICSNIISLRSPTNNSEEFIDLDYTYTNLLAQYNHHPHHNNNNNNLIISSSQSQPQESTTNHDYSSASANEPIHHQHHSHRSGRHHHNHHHHHHHHQHHLHHIEYGDDLESCSDSETQKTGGIHKDASYPPRRRPGRPRGSRRKKPEKLGRLWEFLRDLLLNPESCPSLICWDNYEEGTFRFVHSDKVAKLWGAKRENPDMNYEKLSRAMRYYYKSKVLQPVIGRRLVYKFGPEARGWKTENPNFTY